MKSKELVVGKEYWVAGSYWQNPWETIEQYRYTLMDNVPHWAQGWDDGLRSRSVVETVTPFGKVMLPQMFHIVEGHGMLLFRAVNEQGKEFFAVRPALHVRGLFSELAPKMQEIIDARAKRNADFEQKTRDNRETADAMVARFAALGLSVSPDPFKRGVSVNEEECRAILERLEKSS